MIDIAGQDLVGGNHKPFFEKSFLEDIRLKDRGYSFRQCLYKHWFMSLVDAQKLENWRNDFNKERLHGGIGNKPQKMLESLMAATSPHPRLKPKNWPSRSSRGFIGRWGTYSERLTTRFVMRCDDLALHSRCCALAYPARVPGSWVTNYWVAGGNVDGWRRGMQIRPLCTCGKTALRFVAGNSHLYAMV